MPYIEQGKRLYIDDDINELKRGLISNFGSEDIEGALHYVIAQLLEVIPQSSSLSGEWRYKYINRASGVLTQVQENFDERIVKPYERMAMEKNGDISSYAKFDDSRK
jgi:hypothetical protein